MTCIFCASDKIETQMTITLDDGSKVTVDICAEHSEEATVKSARAAYQERQKQINEVLEQAKKLGLDLTPTKSGLLVPQSTKKPQLRQQIQDTQVEPETFDDNDMIDVRGIDDAILPVRITENRSGLGGMQDTYKTGGLSSKLPEDALTGKAKVELMEGRCGMQIPIASKKIDGTGATTIRIINSGGDSKLQQRFKNMAQSSIDGHSPDFRNGYGDTLRQCPICYGSGEINNSQCPKCQGLGEITI